MTIREKHWTWAGFIAFFLLVAAGIFAVSLQVGEIKISLLKIPGIFSTGEETLEYIILKQIRLPRIILGLSVGGALSLAGVILQGVYRNPLVEPYTLGISGGAALGVALSIVFELQQRFGLFMLPTAGFLGALVTVFLVYLTSMRKGSIKIENMLLIGIMISFIASSAMMLLMSLTTSENIHGILFWIMGSLDETNSLLIYITSITSVAGLIGSYFFVQPLNALRLGEEKARHLGINTETQIRILFIMSSLLTGICVAVAGVIGFVGLVIPHLVRLWVGTDFKILLISSFITGGSFLVLCDTIARTIISPNELPIGVITGIIGGIVFITVLSRMKRRA